jgi:hypothetical protein
MKGNRFPTIPEMETATKNSLSVLTKHYPQCCFKSWQDCRKKFIAEGTTLKVTKFVCGRTFNVLFYCTSYFGKFKPESTLM